MRQLKSARDLDVIFMPLVAFDEFGGRLGMGGGFYDRTLRFVARRRAWSRPHLVGLAYDLQRVPKVHGDSWDVALAKIVTEHSVYKDPTSVTP